MPTQDEFMRAVDTKLEHARFFYNAMCRVFDPPRPSQWEVARNSASMASWNRMPDWHVRIYANLDGFLAMARSVPEVARALLGVNRSMADMKAWFDSLPTDARPAPQVQP